MHIVLTGNPGTGKTTMARKLGEILAAIGYLDSGHVVEVDRSQMVSPYQGETPRVVNRLCDKAMGGILFVDEAYTLAPVSQAGDRDNQGAQALETLMKRMEDDRDKFVVIAAGYRTEMENLFRVNPGMRSRFNYFLNLADYTPDELFQILEVFARGKQYVFSEEAEQLARKMIGEMYDQRDKDFANGRTMRTLFDEICKRQARRLQEGNVSEMSNEQLMTIEVEDIPYEAPKEVDYKECLKRGRREPAERLPHGIGTTEDGRTLEQHDAHPRAPPPHDVFAASERCGHYHFKKHHDQNGKDTKRHVPSHAEDGLCRLDAEAATKRSSDILPQQRSRVFRGAQACCDGKVLHQVGRYGVKLPRPRKCGNCRTEQQHVETVAETLPAARHAVMPLFSCAGAPGTQIQATSASRSKARELAYKNSSASRLPSPKDSIRTTRGCRHQARNTSPTRSSPQSSNCRWSRCCQVPQ
jgi:hypothetical protein